MTFPEATAMYQRDWEALHSDPCDEQCYSCDDLSCPVRKTSTGPDPDCAATWQRDQQKALDYFNLAAGITRRHAENIRRGM